MRDQPSLMQFVSIFHALTLAVCIGFTVLASGRFVRVLAADAVGTPSMTLRPRLTAHPARAGSSQTAGLKIVVL